MNPHEIAFKQWMYNKAKPWLTSKRGRYSELARHLQVSRQTVSRWFTHEWSTVPGWAGVAMNIYLNRLWQAEQTIQSNAVVTPQVNNRFQNLEFVTGSEDKLVTPQVDNVVTADADIQQRQLVRRL